MASPKYPKIISAENITLKEYFEELVQHRHLIWVFALQEFKTQFVQTRLNLLWVVLRPLMVLALFTFIFDRLIKIPGLNYPYFLFAFSGLLVWNNFSFLVNNGGNVIISNQDLIKKVYFPKVILLLSKLLISLIELGVSLIIIFVMILIMQIPLSYKLFLLPVFLLISIMVGISIALWLNALNIKHRDLHQFAPTLIGFAIWLTPVFYPVTLIPEGYSKLLYLNPISAAIQGSRWCLLGDSLPSIYYLPTILFFLLFFIAGFVYFVKTESAIADHV